MGMTVNTVHKAVLFSKQLNIMPALDWLAAHDKDADYQT